MMDNLTDETAKNEILAKNLDFALTDDSNYFASLINGVAGVCYEAARVSGWHTDIKTGLPQTAEDHGERFPLRIALCHSELSEALEGHRKGLADDKLPHRPMAEVELADTVIRIFDLAGAMGYDIGGALIEKIRFNMKRSDHRLENRKAEGGKAY